MATIFQPGDRVEWNAWGRVGDRGTVVSFHPFRTKGSGGSKAKVKVRWDATGRVSSVEDRVLQRVEDES